MRRTIPWLLFGVSLFAALCSFILLLNAGAMLDDARSEVARLGERSELVLSIARKGWIGKKADAVANLASELEQKGVIAKRTEGAFEIGQVIFEVSNGVVIEVRYFD